jgi:glutamate N-acetyltransferase/amino-acid N-acetyltransferase
MSISAISPLAPDSFPDLPTIKGLALSTAAADIKYANRSDVMLAVLAPGTAVAGTFTRSQTRSAAVLDCQEKISTSSREGAAILVNSGNSNAFTGKAGFASVQRLTKAVGEKLALPASRVFTSSTGVIGEPLPDEKITAVLDNLCTSLCETNLQAAAEAIRTTDTFAKGAAKTITIDGTDVNIAGIAKGSGMIAPDMATMLVYIFTDAKCETEYLQALLSSLTDKTFNRITVDSDTSTSDTVLLAATGVSEASVDGNTHFEQALHDVMRDLAHQVVRDGEGATKFIEINVSGAAHDSDAQKVAMSVANSPLVKTAVAGEDPNWGRLIMAIGKSGAQAERDLITLHFADLLVAENGWVAPSYTEEAGAAQMRKEKIIFNIDLGLGAGTGQAWTCDLTHGYITINADYRS